MGDIEDVILAIIKAIVDRLYYGIEYVDEYFELSIEDFIKIKLKVLKTNYKFLIFIGEGEVH